jgi:hypothetical protein
VTDSSGFYRAVALPAGIYTVSASLPGFRPKTMEGTELFLNRTVTIDIALDVGERAESVAASFRWARASTALCRSPRVEPPGSYAAVRRTITWR